MASKTQAQPKHPPFDTEVEQALLGMCLADNDRIDKAAEILMPEDFYDPLHQRTFEMILQLRTEGDVTPLILHSVMKSDPGVVTISEQVHNYFEALLDGAPSVTSFMALANLVRGYSQRRALIASGTALLEQAHLSPQEAKTTDIAEEFQRQVDEILSGASSAHSRRAVAASDAASDLMRRIEEQAVAEKPHGVKTGIDGVDDLIGGLYPGKLLVAGGRPGMGKSILGTNIARAVAAKLDEPGSGIPVDYLSGEMDNDELSARVGCEIDFDRCAQDALKPMPYADFQHMKATAEMITRMAHANMILRGLDLTFFDVSDLSLEWIEAICRRRSRQKPGHRLVVIDHLQLIDLVAARRGANRNEIQTEITKRLKKLAKALGITILLLSQLSREVEKRDDKHPVMSDLREGGSIEQDADVVMLIHRPQWYAEAAIKRARNSEERHKATLAYDEAKGVLEVSIPKNRGGRPAQEPISLFINEKASTIRDKHKVVPADEAGTLDWGRLAEEMRGGV